MFGVNSWELLILVGLFFVLFGPERLPEVIGQVTRLARDLQRMADDATAELKRELDAAVGESRTPVSPPAATPPTSPAALGPSPGPVEVPSGPSPGAAGQPPPSPSIFRTPDADEPTEASGR